MVRSKCWIHNLKYFVERQNWCFCWIFLALSVPGFAHLISCSAVFQFELGVNYQLQVAGCNECYLTREAYIKCSCLQFLAFLMEPSYSKVQYPNSAIWCQRLISWVVCSLTQNLCCSMALWERALCWFCHISWAIADTTGMYPCTGANFTTSCREKTPPRPQGQRPEPENRGVSEKTSSSRSVVFINGGIFHPGGHNVWMRSCVRTLFLVHSQ